MSSDSSSRSDRPPTPFWLGAVRSFERAIGGPAERWLTSDAYFDLLPHARRAQAQLEATVAALTDEWYRFLNFPTGSDMRQMRKQLARMERQLQRIAKELEDARASTESKPAAPDETD